MNRKNLTLAACLLGAALATLASAADAPTADTLARPADLRELVFLTSGYGMAYGPARELVQGAPPFTNVYVNPPAYRSFMQSGQWPEGTTFFLEVRRGVANASIDSAGRSQGDLVALEAAVKDSSKYPDGGWAYFGFNGPDGHALDKARLFPRSANCYSCHSKHGAVEWTFTQFYPDQFAVAQRKGTVRKDYDPNLKAE
jgi:hypothetical protein